MRVLLSTIGSRGDVQPLVALGLHLRALGHDVRLCVPPDFAAWIAGLDLQVTTIGPHLPEVARRAQAVGALVCTDGAATAAQRLVAIQRQAAMV